MPDKIEWEIDVICQIEVQGEITTSDAQGIMDIRLFEVQQAWGKGMSPEDAAALILKASTVETGGDRSHWRIDVIFQLETQLKIATSDAQGLFEAHPFEVQQAWGWRMTPEAAADHIIQVGRVKKTNNKISTDRTSYARVLGYNGPSPVLVLDGKVLSCENLDWPLFCDECREGKYADSTFKDMDLRPLPQYGCVVGVLDGALFSGPINSDGSWSADNLCEGLDPWATCKDDSLSKDDVALEFLIAVNALLGTSFKLSQFGKRWGDVKIHKAAPENT